MIDVKALKVILEKDTLVQSISFVKGTTTVTSRIGRVFDVDFDGVLILVPHNDKKIKAAYGGDIYCKCDIMDTNDIVEILLLDDDIPTLDQIIKENERQDREV